MNGKDNTIEGVEFNQVLNKEITVTFKEREFMLLGMLTAKAENEFMKEYERRASMTGTEPENASANLIALYEFYRDSALMLESMVPKMQKAIDEQGTMSYSFEQFNEFLKGEKDAN